MLNKFIYWLKFKSIFRKKIKYEIILKDKAFIKFKKLCELRKASPIQVLKEAIALYDYCYEQIKEGKNINITDSHFNILKKVNF